MHELSTFERRLAVGLDAVAGPSRTVDAMAITRVAASRAPVGGSILSRFSAAIVRSRNARPLTVLVVIALAAALTLGALAIGSQLVRLLSVEPQPSPMPSPTLVVTPGAAVWSATGSMTVGRNWHTATKLLDGRVLVAGGEASPSQDRLASAEIYDPSTGIWTETTSMNVPRSFHTATLLADGRVLVEGGELHALGDPGATDTAEIYDPASGSWTITGRLNGRRQGQTATLLPDGRVLVAGGSSQGDLYDPATGAWTLVDSFVTPREDQVAVLLADGRVLVAGGIGILNEAPSSDSAELFDPTAGTWTATGSLPVRPRRHTATVLADGRVLVAGGIDENARPFEFFDAAELYDPSSGTWAPTGTMLAARYGQTAVLLLDGNVLVVGGLSYGATTDRILATAELFHPADGTWSAAAAMAAPRVGHTTTLLVDGSVLAAGGISVSTGEALTSAERYGGTAP
ncbi:MAG TPA: kelch repeat-containing protein [Candidatus Polarisedimenticolia bacterium]|nr:kelch repeat-containing protein [Candidatus Polarisedimenticolia bacterium]